MVVALTVKQIVCHITLARQQMVEGGQKQDLHSIEISKDCGIIKQNGWMASHFRVALYI